MKKGLAGSATLVGLGVATILLGRTSGARAADSQANSEPEEQVVLSGTVDVPRGSVVGEVVVFHGRVTVEGVVVGDVVVLNGPITISGQVSGSVVSLHGPILLRSSAQVGRDVLSGGSVSVEAGARVSGRIRRDVAFTLSPQLAVLGVLLASLMMAVSLLLLGLLLLAFVPRGAERVALAARGAPWLSAGWGLLLGAGLPPLAAATMATIVGLPLGLTLLLALAFLFLVGFAWTAWSVGRAILPPPRSRWAAFAVGWGIATLLGLVPGLNVVVWLAGSVFGLGAMSVAGWRARREPAPPLPPVPPSVAGVQVAGTAASEGATEEASAPESAADA